ARPRARPGGAARGAAAAGAPPGGAAPSLRARRFGGAPRPKEGGPGGGGVGFPRRNFLVPVPAADSWEGLNRVVEQRCRADLSRRLRGQPATKAQLLEGERPALRPLPAHAFEARRVGVGRADSLSLVPFDRDRYSGPTA